MAMNMCCVLCVVFRLSLVLDLGLLAILADVNADQSSEPFIFLLVGGSRFKTKINATIV